VDVGAHRPFGICAQLVGCESSDMRNVKKNKIVVLPLGDHPRPAPETRTVG